MDQRDAGPFYKGIQGELLLACPRHTLQLHVSKYKNVKATKGLTCLCLEITLTIVGHIYQTFEKPYELGIIHKVFNGEILLDSGQYILSNDYQTIKY